MYTKYNWVFFVFPNKIPHVSGVYLVFQPFLSVNTQTGSVAALSHRLSMVCLLLTHLASISLGLVDQTF